MSLYHEHQQSLAPFFIEELITDVVAQLQSGKEATIFLCRAHPSAGHETLVAKVYRAHVHRTFRNDADYLEGMFPTARDLRAVVRKNNFKGRSLKFGSWIEREFALLQSLHTAGAAVPGVIERSHDTILMEFVASGEDPAPMLKLVRPDRDQARHLFDGVMLNIEILLACDCVHADLSEYNILHDGTDAWLIDFPQAIDARFNSNAWRFLVRDIDRVCRYFARFGVEADAIALAGTLWEQYVLGEL